MPEYAVMENGEPVRVEHAWVVIERINVDEWWPNMATVSCTRSAAIAKYDRGLPGCYRRARRRGEAKAVRCRIVVDA